MAAYLPRPADRPAARPEGHRPLRPRGRRETRPRGPRRHPPAALRPGPAAPRRRPTPSPSPGRGTPAGCVRIGGLTVLTDPVWSRRILGTPARITPVGVAWERACRPSTPSSSATTTTTTWTPPPCAGSRATPPCSCPAGLGRWFHRRRFTRVTELDWWEAAELDGVRFDFVPAHHWSKRTLTDTCHSLWGGWVLTAPRRTARLLRGRHRLRPLVHPHRPALPRHRPRPAAHRRLRPALVAQRRPLRPGGGGPRRPGPRRPADGAHALGDVRPLGGTGPGAAHPRCARHGRRRACAREDLWDLPVGASRVLD